MFYWIALCHVTIDTTSFYLPGALYYDNLHIMSI